MICENFERQALQDVTISKLTQRQVEVLELVAQAYTNEEIANKLFITRDTVKTHLKSIYRRFDFSYCNNTSSVFRLRIALLWLQHKSRILGLDNHEILECNQN